MIINNFQFSNSSVIFHVLDVFTVLLPILLSVAFVTIQERKQLAAHQRRVGPDTVGYYGILQPFSDALKLILKENIIPAHSNKFLFVLAPVSTLIFSLLGWGIVPFGQGLAISDWSLGILYTLALSSLGVTWKFCSVWVDYSNLLLPTDKSTFKQYTNYNIKIITQCLQNLAFVVSSTGPTRPGNLVQANSNKFYSTNNTSYSTLNNLSLEEFAHWFSGFCDAESNFYILDLGNRFSFYFYIKLHLDDIKVLHYLNYKLELGKVYTHEDTCTFRINKFEELHKLFNILDIKPLNTTKYLNYLAFKEGLFLYYNQRNTQLSLRERSIIFNKIRELKNSMNTLRTKFILPDTHKILITPYWLLGFFEGDGSLPVSNIKSFPLRFNIVQSITEKEVIEQIKLFLLEVADSTGSFNIKKINSNPIQIIESTNSKFSDNTKLCLNLNINDQSFLSKIIVPFFNKLQFFTKKELDFKDWKNILELKTRGWHLSEEAANLIVAISRQMNNNRLSTNTRKALSNSSGLELDTEKENSLNYNLLLEKVTDFLGKPSNFEVYPDGKIFIKSSQKFWKGRGNVKIEVYDKEGFFLYSFDNLEMTAKFFNVNKHIIKYRLNSGKALILPTGEFYFKRYMSF
jgi:hypothetical protein